jgi:hypothetical protein
MSHAAVNPGNNLARQTGGHKMLKIRLVLIVLVLLLSSAAYADSRVTVSIGINVPVYPELVVMPGYPVYYAPELDANYFFYDGLYWVYQDDNWYSSYWYDGPWWYEEPEFVPVFILRIPVRYYRRPPLYFHGWFFDAPPHWGDHWGHDWAQRHSDWDRWDRHATPAPAPLPLYQRQYSGDRYPRQVEHQHELQNRNYRYQPRDPVIRQHLQERAAKKAPVQQEKPSHQNREAPVPRVPRQEDSQRTTPQPQVAPAAPRHPSFQSGDEDRQRSTTTTPQQWHPATQDGRQRLQPEPDQRRMQTPRSLGREDGRTNKDFTPEPRRKKEQGQEQGRGRDRHE